MKKFKLLLIFLLLTLTLLGNTKYFMWQVKDADSTVYLAPTVHLLSDNFYPINEKVMEKLKESNFLAVEFDVTNNENLQTIATQGIKYMYNEGFVKISTLINPEDFEKLKVAFEKRGVDIAPLEFLSPFFLSQTLIQLELANQGYDTKLGLDEYFINFAKANNIAILELENPIYQLKLLSEVDKDYMLNMLIGSSNEEELKEGIELLKKLVLALQNGDSKEFEKIFNQMIEKDGKKNSIHEKILDERNVGMTDKIISYLQDQGTYFVAVGGGHYVGTNSIIDILESKGYEVVEVNLD